MGNPHISLETHGTDYIPDHGILIVSNRLGFEDLLHLEKFFSGRKLVYLIERGMQYDPLLQDFLEKDDIEAMEFSCEESLAGAFKRELYRCIEEGSIVVFVPGMSHVRIGQTITVPSRVLDFVCSSGASILPMFVDHPEESCLSTENRSDVARIVFSFGRPLEREGANLANFTENLLVAGERAYSSRPILQSHLAFELIKGLKKHGASSRIVDGTDESVLSYSKLLAAAIAFSRQITKLTAKKRVGIILPPGKAGLLSNLAVLFAGKIPVNLNFTAGEAATRSCIEQADIDRFITANPFVEKMESFAWPDEEKLLMVDKILPPLKKNIAMWMLVVRCRSAEAIARMVGVPRTGGDEEAVLLFTSGSSGNPKGVVLTHRNLLANVNQFGSRISLRSDDSVLGCLPLFHSFGCTVTMWYPIIEGVNLVTFPSPLDAARLAELIEKFSISMVVATPTFLRGYMRRATPEQFRSVKLVITGAEKLPSKMADAFQKRFDKIVYEGYGLTETSPVSNVNLPDRDERDIEEDDGIPVIPNHRPGSVGLLIPGIAVRITDPETFEPRSLHSSGMIWLKGANVFGEYLDLPEKTREVMMNQWFMTGDIGRVDEDGFLYIEGRLSRFSKIAGEMVPHETVEGAVTKALDLGDEERKIAVVGLPDESKGEILVMLSREEINQTELRTRLSEAGIPALWMPKQILQIEEIPILASGKLDIKACEELARSRA